MKLHTKLDANQVHGMLASTQLAGQMTWDVEFVQFIPEASRSKPYGFKIQLGTYDQHSGPTNSRHYKNSGTHGSHSGYHTGERVWAATYEEWGWFIARIMDADPEAKFGDYNGQQDFDEKTRYAFILEAE